MSRRTRPGPQATPSVVNVYRPKLLRIVSRHEQLKISFRQLHSQITAGLLEAEDVFASLALQLTKLVGLKTIEMACEGRFSTIVTFGDRSRSQLLPEENYMSRAITAGNEMIERQKLQLTKLVNLLKNIEAQINSRHKRLFEDLADHQTFIKKIFIKALGYVSAIQHSGQPDDLPYMLRKILKASYDQVGNALGSVEVGIDDLICELAQEMCRPMVEYVNGLKRDMQTGTCSCFLEIIKEMDKEIKIRRSELEEAREQARLAEKSKIEALNMLKISEERVKNLTISLGSLTGDSTESAGDLSPEKLSTTKEDPVKDDNLLWQLLRNKRKCQMLDSPQAPKELLGTGTLNKKPRLKTPSFSHRPLTRAQTRSCDLRSSSINSRMLFTSPSQTTNKVLSRKRVTP